MISLAILLTQLLFGDIRLVTNDSLPAGVFALPKPSGTYSTEAFRSYTSLLKEQLDYQGYWYSELHIERVELDSTSYRVHIDLRVTLNEQVHVQFIRFEGVDTLPESYYLGALRFTPGRIATLDELNQLRDRLLALDDVTDVSEPRLITEDGKDGLMFTLRPSSRHRSDVIIGYANRQVVGQVALHLRHLLIPGTRLDVRFHRLQPYQNRLDLEVGASFASGTFRLFQQDSTFLTRSWMVGADWPLTSELSLGAWIEQQSTSLGVIVPGLDVEEGTRSVAGLRMGWRPMAGRYVTVSSGAGRRNGIPVQLATARWSGMLRPEERIHWVFSGSAAVMLSERIPIDNLYRFGGATSFRGYREDELQASRYVWTELESRYMLDSNSYAFLFAGSAALPASSVLFNSGFGFSLPTRLGPLRFTYAGSSRHGILQGVVHVSLSNGL